VPVPLTVPISFGSKPRVTVTSVRRIALVLGALSMFETVTVLWSDRFIAADAKSIISVREACTAGLIQGLFLLNLLLVVTAVGLWRR
jgi:hypothetical protein